MGEFVMPSLGADMEYGTLLEWHVRVGDTVRRGDTIALVETDKAAIEVEVFESGTVDALLVQPGTRVRVGTPLATIRGVTEAGTPATTSGAAVVTPSMPAPAPGPIPEAAPRGERAAQGANTAPPTARRRVSPLARETARRLGVDIEQVTGSGPGGAVTQVDVERAAVPRTLAPEGTPVVDRAASMRRAIAAAVSRSNREIPHYYLEESVDFSMADRWLAARNAGRPAHARVIPAALFVRAVAMAARAVPQLNGAWQADHFEPASNVHVGMAIAMRDAGLMAPAILDADRKSVDEVMGELLEVTRAARRGRLRSSQLTSSTITVTSLGDRGTDRVFGVIYPPQVALVGFGRIADRPCAVDGRVEVRSSVNVTLAADHRASDGYTGARFLRVIRDVLQDPERL